MHTQEGVLPEPFEGIDGHFYRYVDPRKADSREYEVVAEYEFTCTWNGEDELLADRYVMAQRTAKGSVDHEFLLFGSDWISLDRLSDQNALRMRLEEARATRTRGVVVTSAFAKILAEATLRDLPPEPLLEPPALALPEMPLSGPTNSRDPETLTRDEARDRIDARIERLIAKHRELDRMSTQRALQTGNAPEREVFSPPENMFIDLRFADTSRARSSERGKRNREQEALAKVASRRIRSGYVRATTERPTDDGRVGGSSADAAPSRTTLSPPDRS